MIAWLLGAAIGPAAVALPVNWAADSLADAAQRWFRRLRRTDDLSRLVRAATGTSIHLTKPEFDSVRQLLEAQQTWTLAGHGTVEDLAARIAECLPPGNGRTSEDSRAAAMTIARGLLEFAVADLDPKLFQQLLLTRLQRMETDQASALDQALFDLHADLTARFADVMGSLKRVLDRLPPGPARRAEVAVYLTVLISWLNSDPWPRDRRFNGPALTPATIERKLRVTVEDRADGRELDADQLARRCKRLVILGAPGSGKTWLAKRTARRCAEDALEGLAAGHTLDEIELPLYTTCSRLFTAVGDTRTAVVLSALDQIGDLGGSRLSAALHVFFTERNAPTLLVLDSLDEANGSADRLFQADTLPWRIVLTTRPSSWNRQLAIDNKDDSHRIGELQVLRYPGDVEPFIRRWFGEDPGAGTDLIDQIANRPDLQQAATVPLILAFYCILSGSGNPLPDFRRDLYSRVLKRMLTGRWRSNEDHLPDIDECLQILRGWAWSGTAQDHVSGVGTWADDIPTGRVRLSNTAEDALDHIAAPLGPPDIDTGTTWRRFIHRTLREHLVAEHVASLTVPEAADALLAHLWYDPDWEYPVAAALAMHPQRDQLLSDLICRAARSDHIPGDLSVIGARDEFRQLLARVAAESSEDDWSPEVARLIHQARIELARAACIDHLAESAHWTVSNREARDALLALLTGERSWDASRLIGSLIRLDPTAADKRLARDSMLKMLARRTSDWDTQQGVDRTVQLTPTAGDRRHARDALLGFLAGEGRTSLARKLADGVVQLSPTAQDKSEVVEVLLRMLPSESRRVDGRILAGTLRQLGATAEDTQRARRELLAMLATQTSASTAVEIASTVSQLGATPEDTQQARHQLLAMLAIQTSGKGAAEITSTLAQLGATAQETQQARDQLLAILATTTSGSGAADLARTLGHLGVSPQDGEQVRQHLIAMLPGEVYSDAAEELVGVVVLLAPSAEDKRHARAELIGLLTGRTNRRIERWADLLVDGLVQLDSEAEDKRQACDALLPLVTIETDSWTAARMANAVHGLDPTAEDKRQIREALLTRLATETDYYEATTLLDELAQPAPTSQEGHQVRQAILELLSVQTDGWLAMALADGLLRFRPTAEDKRRARQALLQLLPASKADVNLISRGFVRRIVKFDPSAEDKRLIREVVLELLETGLNDRMFESLVPALAQLDPTVHDLTTWRSWGNGPNAELLAAARRNTPLAEWLEALPSLTSRPA